MAALRLGRTEFRLLFIPYALGLSIWLLLGVLPTLAADVPAVHHLVASLALHHAFAARVLHPQMPGSMGPDMTTTLQAVLQYAFSLVNLGLGVSAGNSNVSYQTHVLTNRNSGLVADVSGASYDRGTSIEQWYENDNWNQQWYFSPAIG